MRTMIGVDSTGAGCVKIMKSIFDDPRTTPDSEKHKFLYNSKWDSQIRVHDIERIEYRGAGSGRQYDPPGSNDDNYARLIMEGNGVPETSYSFRKSFFPNLAYAMPLIDVKWRRPSDGRYVQNQVRKQDGPGVYGYGGYWSTGGSEERGWGENMSGIRGTLNYGTVITLNMRDYGPYMDLGMEKRLIVWNLPGDQTPIADAKALAPVSGQMAVQITPTHCRVAKPGYDVRNAMGTQLAFDSSNRPAKVIAAGDIDIPNGVSYHNTGIALPANVVADIHFYDAGGPVYYPANPGNLGKGAEYWFEGTHIGFYNPNAACRGRFLVLAEDDTPMTAGSNRVFRETVENGRTAIQFLRPGAGPNPSFADIIVDSRWPALQLLAEGTLNVGGGAQTQTVNFAGGFFPFVKYMTIHPGFSGIGHVNHSRMIRMPFIKTLQDAGAYGVAPAGDSSYVILTGNQAIFHTFVGNPVNRYFTRSSNYPRAITNDLDRTPIIAIRYFIFGIPTA